MLSLTLSRPPPPPPLLPRPPAPPPSPPLALAAASPQCCARVAAEASGREPFPPTWRARAPAASAACRRPRCSAAPCPFHSPPAALSAVLAACRPGAPRPPARCPLPLLRVPPRSWARSPRALATLRARAFCYTPPRHSRRASRRTDQPASHAFIASSLRRLALPPPLPRAPARHLWQCHIQGFHCRSADVQTRGRLAQAQLLSSSISMASKPKQPHGAPMTLGNMRDLGVRNLLASCLNDPAGTRR